MQPNNPFFDEMVAITLPVTQSERVGQSTSGWVTRVGPQGLEAVLEPAPSGTYSWLEFVLPESGYRIKALGEVTALTASADGKRVVFRFKHVFPRDRAALGDFLSHRAAA